MEPIRITLAGETYITGGVTWRTYKQISRLAGSGSSNATESDIYNIAGLICEIFGYRFGVSALLGDAPVTTLIGVLNTIMARANELTPKVDTQDAMPEPDNPKWIVNLEIALVNRFEWSLADIDSTDIFTLFSFLAGLSGEAQSDLVYCDDPRISAWL